MLLGSNLVNKTDEVAEDSAQRESETAAASDELSSRTQDLGEMTSRFKL
jgi:methyl-accepting chemotaxis protein